jgi:hypothetical protein
VASKPQILVARETFTAEYDGAPVVVHGGVTRVRSDHPLVKGREHLFEAAESRVDVEQATAAPGEKRGIRRRSK